MESTDGKVIVSDDSIKMGLYVCNMLGIMLVNVGGIILVIDVGTVLVCLN